MTIVFNDFTRVGAKPAEIFALLIGNVQLNVRVKVSELEADYYKELLQLQREWSKLQSHHREELTKLKDQHFDELFKLKDELLKLKLHHSNETNKAIQYEIQYAEESKELCAK